MNELKVVEKFLTDLYEKYGNFSIVVTKDVFPRREIIIWNSNHYNYNDRECYSSYSFPEVFDILENAKMKSPSVMDLINKE